MSFENEVIECILQHSPEAEIADAGLIGKSVSIGDKNIVFHLLPVSFVGLNDVSPTYFQEKSLEYASNGIQLVHLWQDCWITKQERVRSRIAVFSGAYTRIHARRTFVRRIPRDVMFEFFANNHMQGFVDARYNYGMYCDERLVAAASFSAGRKMARNGISVRSFELVRYSNLLNHRVAGGLGKLIARFIKDVNPDDIMTYADLDWASGVGYKALNFEQTAITPPQSFWIHPHNMIRYYPHRLPQKMTDDFRKQSTYRNIDDFLKNTGYIKIYNAGNLKYLLNLNSLNFNN